MKSKKVLALLLVLVMSLSMCACGAKTTEEDEKESVAVSEEDAQEDDSEENDSEDAEEVEITYTPCTVEQFVNDVGADLDAAQEKYADQYLELSGILEECEISDSSNPPSKIVRLQTNFDDSVETPVLMVAAYSWDEEDYSLEDFKKAMNELQPGDSVVVKVYVSDYFYDEGMYAVGLDLLGIEKQ